MTTCTCDTFAPTARMTRGFRRLIDSAAYAISDVPEAAEEVSKRLFGNEQAITVTSSGRTVHVGLSAFAELALYDVVDIGRSQSSDEVKTRRVGETLRLAGF
jgi:hypothetical protein